MASLKTILEHIYTAQKNLNEVASEIMELLFEPRKTHLKHLGLAFTNINAIEKSIYEIDPSLEPEDHFEEPDSDLTAEQLLLVSKLTDADVDEIDKFILKSASNRRQKVAKIVGIVMMEMPERVKGIPDIYYSQRIKNLVKQGFLKSYGNLDYMRYSEVCLSNENT